MRKPDDVAVQQRVDQSEPDRARLGACGRRVGEAGLAAGQAISGGRLRWRRLVRATVEHIVDAWEQATSGDPQPLRLVASKPAAATSLERLGENSARFALREAAVDRWQLTDLTLAATRPQLQLDLDVSAVRYLWADASGYRAVAPTGGTRSA